MPEPEPPVPKLLVQLGLQALALPEPAMKVMPEPELMVRQPLVQPAQPLARPLLALRLEMPHEAF